ncbi:MAG: alpha-glucan family phosphorylase [Thermodesulfobacteriota bacterium]
MKRILTYQVYPKIPDSLGFLDTLSRNLWWCWKPDAIDLFRRIDSTYWKNSNGNPILLLSTVSQDRLEELAKDESFLSHMNRVKERFDSRVVHNVESSRMLYDEIGPVAYFSMEFGIHESLPIFAGGLGMLAGDHLKAASNMSLPMVGIGLLYRNGYFTQHLNPDGWQQEEYPEIELYYLPIERARDLRGNEITISIPGPQGEIRAIVWKIRVGRTILILLDTNLPENPPEIREITGRLYAAEQRIRLAQEILLGIGGVRALWALGIFPSICHLNEGHPSFSAFERLLLFMKQYKLDLKTAVQLVRCCTVFTTHTPVAAGYDAFPPDLVRPYLQPFQGLIGIDTDQMISWGQPAGSDRNAPFSMFILGMKFSRFHNAVSRLHGKTARRMWAHLWPGKPKEEIPISHVTNGIHVSTFISPEIAMLFDRHLGPEWYMSSRRPENITRIDEIYDEELWRAHEMARNRLIHVCRENMKQHYEMRNAPQTVIDEIDEILDPGILTIAFARRFVAYKRADLLLQNPQRLAAILNSSTRPVQIIFAGKAHPRDDFGKEIIKKIIQFVRRPEFRKRIVFVEGYDMALAKYLVHGADVWLNTPRRPNEACGTSGMKAAFNGVLNVSILDGWWCEGYSEDRGWRIGGGEEYQDPAYQDAVESQALYNVLENHVIPCFYERRGGEIPIRWVKMMKESMKMTMKDFCSLRMLDEYERRYYIPIFHRMKEMLKDNGSSAKRLAKQEERFYAFWKQIRLGSPIQSQRGPFRVGEKMEVAVDIHLGEIKPEEVDVELYNGHMKTSDTLENAQKYLMKMMENYGNGSYRFQGIIPCVGSGRFGFTIRITPQGEELLKDLPGLIAWS